MQVLKINWKAAPGIPEAAFLVRYRWFLNLRVLAGTQPKWRIERAKANGTGQYKHTGEHQQNDAQSARDGIRKIQSSNDHSNNDPDQFVGVSHVLFHDVLGFNKLNQFDQAPD